MGHHLVQRPALVQGRRRIRHVEAAHTRPWHIETQGPLRRLTPIPKVLLEVVATRLVNPQLQRLVVHMRRVLEQLLERPHRRLAIAQAGPHNRGIVRPRDQRQVAGPERDRTTAPHLRDGQDGAGLAVDRWCPFGIEDRVRRNEPSARRSELPGPGEPKLRSRLRRSEWKVRGHQGVRCGEHHLVLLLGNGPDGSVVVLDRREQSRALKLQSSLGADLRKVDRALRPLGTDLGLQLLSRFQLARPVARRVL